jgi:hypothetical protein
LNKSEAVALTPKTAQPYLAMKLAEELHAQVAFTLDSGVFAIRVTQPQVALANAS